MATATLVQSQTITPGNADWTQPLGFAQFDPAFGTLLDVRITIQGDVAGSALIENLGATAALAQLQLSETVSIYGTDGSVLAVGQTRAGAGAYLAANDGTIDLNGYGNSGRVISGITGTATNTATYTPGVAAFGLFMGTGSVRLTATGSVASSETGDGNLLSLLRAQAGATVTVQYDYQPPSGGGGGGGGGGASDFTVFPLDTPQQYFWPNETATPTQNLIVADALTGWNTTVAAAQFNPDLGTLEAVSLTLTGDINSGFAAENLGLVAAPIGMTDTANVVLTLANGTPVSASPIVQTTTTLAAYDGTTDFAGPSGRTATGLTGSQTTTQWISDNLASFIGTGTIALPVSASAFSAVSGSADLESKIQTLAGATVGISYIYLPAAASAAPAAPIISGTAAGQTTTDRTTIAPFLGVTISDATAGATQTMTITLSSVRNGKLTNLGGGTYNAATGVYSDTGTAAAITADVEGLVFTPTRELNLGGLAIATVFTIQDTDSAGASVSDSNTSVFATAVVVPPTITGTVAHQTVTAPGSIALFSGVTIGDDMAYPTDTLTVTMSAATNGVLTNLGNGTYNAATGVYTATGSPTAVTADLNGLIFTPTSFSVAPNTQTTSFTIGVSDIYGAAATGSATSVVAAVNPASHCLFQNDDGQLALWQVVGTTLQTASLIGPNPGSSWFAMGTGAFYAGDTSDIVWQNQNGAVAIWQVQGASVLGGAIVTPNPGPTWHIGGIGDFYGNGNTDIL